MDLYQQVLQAKDAAYNISRIKEIIANAEEIPFCYYSSQHEKMLLRIDTHTTSAVDIRASSATLRETAQEIHDTMMAAFKVELAEAEANFQRVFFGE